MEVHVRTVSINCNLEVLYSLLDLDEKIPSLGDYLKSGPVQGWMRDKLMQFIIQICKEIGTTIETSQLAVSIIDHFLSKTRPRKAVLQLMGVVGLMYALKYNDKIVYTLEDAFLHCGKIFKKEDILLAEDIAAEKLGCKFEAPTAAGLARRLVYATNTEMDFSSVLERADFFAMRCYTDYTLSQFSCVAKAVVSVLCALEESNQISFRNLWINFLYTTFNLDFIEIENCKRCLIDHLYRECNSGEPTEYVFLSKGGILTVINREISGQV